MSERQCDLCHRFMPTLVADPELSFSFHKHKCVCRGCFMQQPGIKQAAAQLAEQMLRAHAQRDSDSDDPHWVFKRSMARKKDQMSDETQIKNMDPEAKATEDPYATRFDSTRGLMVKAFSKTSIGKVGAVDIAPTDTATRGLGVEVALRRAKDELIKDYPPFSGDPTSAKYDPRAKAAVLIKIDEALLWLSKVGVLLTLLLCCSCGGLAVVRDKLASYNDEIAVFCPQSDISQKCIDARRRAEVSIAAVQTATLGEQIGKDAQNLITQADIVVGAALEWFKTEFLAKQ